MARLISSPVREDTGLRTQAGSWRTTRPKASSLIYRSWEGPRIRGRAAKGSGLAEGIQGTWSCSCLPIDMDVTQ